jgi:hypothetical protein
MSPHGGVQAESGTTAPFAVAPAPGGKFSVEIPGHVAPAGQRASHPCAEGLTTVAFTDTALAVPGIPHIPFTKKARVALPVIVGVPFRYEPELYVADRVSAIRHGVTA